jgi:glycosyltransferase involved in cell wall biosynthesis
MNCNHHMKTSQKQKIAVFLKGYPRLSETFIAKELLWLEQNGFDLVFFSLRHPTDQKTHPIHDEIQADVIYLPEYLHQHLFFVIKTLLFSLWKNPCGFFMALKTMLHHFIQNPSRNSIRRFGQAAASYYALMQNQKQTGKDFDWIYAHFMHTPASCAMYCSMISQIPWCCSAHAKDIWTSDHRDLQTKLSSMRFLATCTKNNVKHLKHIALTENDSEKVHLIYHGLDFQRFTPRKQAKQRDQNQPLRIITIGRAVPKKGISDW